MRVCTSSYDDDVCAPTNNGAEHQGEMHSKDVPIIVSSATTTLHTHRMNRQQPCPRPCTALPCPARERINQTLVELLPNKNPSHPNYPNRKAVSIRLPQERPNPTWSPAPAANSCRHPADHVVQLERMAAYSCHDECSMCVPTLLTLCHTVPTLLTLCPHCAHSAHTVPPLCPLCSHCAHTANFAHTARCVTLCSHCAPTVSHCPLCPHCVKLCSHCKLMRRLPNQQTGGP
jgi:hypothetical protein